MREKMARAMWEKNQANRDRLALKPVQFIDWEFFLPFVDAALGAMDEPTEAMLNEVLETPVPRVDDDAPLAEKRRVYLLDGKTTWRAMIQAAKDGK